MWYVLSLVAMSISQPSPDRLIFHPERRSTLALQCSYWLVMFIYMGGAGYLIFELGWIFSKILSKSFNVSCTVILNNVPILIFITFFILILVVFISSLLYFSLCTFRFNKITEICIFDRTGSYPDRQNQGQVSIEQLNIFNRKKSSK